MPRIRVRLRLTTLLSAALIACAGMSAHGQSRDTLAAATRLRDPPLTGSARVGLQAAYQPVPGAWEASVAGIIAPFIDEHWQLGIEPVFDVVKDPSYHSYSGGASLLANYLLLHGNLSRPYVGVYLAGLGGTGTPGTTILGVQAGWLRFVRPSVAFRAELAYRHYSGDLDNNSLTVLTLGLDPYLFGRANERITTMPGLGAVDVTGIVEFVIHPDPTVSLQATVAPLLAQWVQPGLSISYLGSGNPNVEFFGRGYLPLAPRLAPFADLFGTANQNDNSHGARVGVRSYLTAGVALDIDWEWRNLDVSGPFRLGEQHTLRASLITQLGSRGSAVPRR